MLKLENISSGYGKKQVLYDVSFEIKKGDIVLLIGSNGSGKSTVLKTIYGIVPVWEGKVFFEDENITNLPTAKLIKKGLMYVPQKNNCFDELTVKENLEVCGLNLPKTLLKERTEKVLELFAQLKPLLNSKPTFLSGGERQQITLACAMLHEPKVLLLDECLTGLAPKNMDVTLEKIVQLNKELGISFLMVEHNVRKTLKITNHVISLKLGKKFTNFEASDVSNENLNLIYN